MATQLNVPMVTQLKSRYDNATKPRYGKAGVGNVPGEFLVQTVGFWWVEFHSQPKCVGRTNCKRTTVTPLIRTKCVHYSKYDGHSSGFRNSTEWGGGGRQVKRIFESNTVVIFVVVVLLFLGSRGWLRPNSGSVSVHTERMRTRCLRVFTRNVSVTVNVWH